MYNAKRNRYTDIACYDFTRVYLQKGVDLRRMPVSDYINASYVNSPFEKSGSEGKMVNGDRKLILTQGPIPLTIDHFWQMVVEQNVSTIFTLCNLKEDGRTKCHSFWPVVYMKFRPSSREFKVTQQIKSEERVKVNLLSVEQINEYIIKREM